MTQIIVSYGQTDKRTTTEGYRVSKSHVVYRLHSRVRLTNTVDVHLRMIEHIVKMDALTF